MKSSRENQRVLLGVVACVGLALSAPYASANPAPNAAPAPDPDRAALVWLRISSPPIESQAQLLRADIRFAIDVAADFLGPSPAPSITRTAPSSIASPSPRPARTPASPPCESPPPTAPATGPPSP